MERVRIEERITVATQPSREELRLLRDEGFDSVLNVRTDAEEDQPMSPATEGREVRALGLTYEHIPVEVGDLTPEVVDGFCAHLETIPKPTLVHSHRGLRSRALALMYLGVKEGWSGAETLRRARELGLSLDEADLAGFVASYVDERSAA